MDDMTCAVISWNTNATNWQSLIKVITAILRKVMFCNRALSRELLVQILLLHLGCFGLKNIILGTDVQNLIKTDNAIFRTIYILQRDH
jgi:hypothetical protein